MSKKITAALLALGIAALTGSLAAYADNNELPVIPAETEQGSTEQTGTDISEYTIEIDEIDEINADGISYTGEEITPVLRVLADEDTVLDSVNYELNFENNVNAGTAAVTVTGVGDYTGTLTAEFEIKPATLILQDYELTVPKANLDYTGSEQRQEVTLKIGDMTLVNGRDYSVLYYNTIKPGYAIAKVQGMGNYRGTLIKTYNIKPEAVKSVSAENVTQTSATVTWPKAEGADGYMVLRQHNYSTVTLARLNDPDALSFEDTGLEAGCEYTYYVSAFKFNTLSSSYLSSANASITLYTESAAPAKVNVWSSYYDSGSDYLRVYWDSVEGADGYKVYKLINGEYTEIGDVGAEATNFADYSVGPQTWYTYMVRAYKTGSSGKLYLSEESAPVSLESDSVDKLYYINYNSSVYTTGMGYVGTIYANAFYTGYYESHYPGYVMISYMSSNYLISAANVIERPYAKVLRTGAIGQMGGNIYGLSACGPAAAAILVNWQKSVAWSKDALILYCENNYLNDQGSLRGGGGITAPNLIRLINNFSGGIYNARNVYGTYGITTATNLINQINNGKRVLVVVQYTSYIVTHYSSGTHFVVVCGYEYINGVLYFYYADPYYGNGPRSLLRVDSYTLTTSMDMVTREPRCMIVLD